MGKLHLSKEDVEKIIGWLSFADSCNDEMLEKASDEEIDSYIARHWEIDTLIRKLEIP